MANGSGRAGPTPFAAVALNKEGHPIKMMTVVDGFKTKTVADWAKRHIASGSAGDIRWIGHRFKAVKEATRAPSVVTGAT